DFVENRLRECVLGIVVNRSESGSIEYGIIKSRIVTRYNIELTTTELLIGIANKEIQAKHHPVYHITDMKVTIQILLNLKYAVATVVGRLIGTGNIMALSCIVRISCHHIVGHQVEIG